MRRLRSLGLVIALVTALAGALVTVLPGTAAAAPGPSIAPEWWFDNWNVASLWAGGADGRGITVAVIDTGVQADIPELQDKVLPGADFIGNGSDGRTDFDNDDFSHGTAMASIIAARSGYGGIEGLAPGARILPIAVPLNGVIRKGNPLPDATARAIDYAADHGARVINMSLGGPRYENRDSDPCPDSIQNAVLYALTKGALVVAAAGNSGRSGSPVEEPGVCLGVISVGAVDARLDVADFSSRHPYLTVTAPGANVATLTREPGSAFIGEGTSQATALTSAAIAVVWSKYPHETSRQVLSRLLGTVTDRGPKGPDPQYGLGVIDPSAAIAAGVAVTAGNNLVLDGAAPLLALARARATVRAPRPTAAARRPAEALGQYRIGSPPTGRDAAFYLRAAGAALFAVLALVLLLIAARRGRRPRASTGTDLRPAST